MIFFTTIKNKILATIYMKYKCIQYKKYFVLIKKHNYLRIFYQNNQYNIIIQGE